MAKTPARKYAAEGERFKAQRVADASAKEESRKVAVAAAQAVQADARGDGSPQGEPPGRPA